MKFWLVCVGLLACALGVYAAEASKAPRLFHLGFYLPTIRDANQVDLKVSLQAWAQELADGFGFQVATSSYQNMADMRAAVDRGELHFVNSGGMELAEAFAPGELMRGYARRQRGTDEGLVLVVRRDSGLTTFSDLRTKRVSRLSNDRLAEIFLETQCLKAAKQRCGQFLTLIEEKRDIQSAYSVFFGKADAALVTLTTWRTATELNPQIATRLKAIQDWKTEALVFGLTTRHAPPTALDAMTTAMDGALRTTRGKQIMELFKTDFVEPVEPSALNPYWALLQEYRVLEKAGAKKK